jgi:hypothetical protein
VWKKGGRNKRELRNLYNKELIPDVVSVKPSKVSPAIKLPTCILDVPSSKPGRGKELAGWYFSSFLRGLSCKCRNNTTNYAASFHKHT